MALKLNIRWQLALVSVALSLLPIAVVGVLAYVIARDALEERIRFNLETLATQSDEKLERLLLDQQQNLAVWSQLGFIRDDNGQEWFFHRSSVEGSFEQLNEGQRVSFEEEPSAKGPRAGNVRGEG